jgi:uncharacterized protein YceK
MRIIVLVSIALLPLSGCALMKNLTAPAVGAPPPVEAAAPLTAIAPMGTGAATAATLDQSTPEQVAAATAPVANGARELGRVVVALGSPAEQGFWIKTPLAVVAGKGRVVTADGKSVNVDLQPGTGGALLSLAAFRALGLGLTDLPEVTVFAE